MDAPLIVQHIPDFWPLECIGIKNEVCRERIFVLSIDNPFQEDYPNFLNY